MPQASSRLPKLITLLWGSDRLEVDDPVWISKIVQEMAEQSQPDEEVEVDLSWPRSLMLERIEAGLLAKGLRSSDRDSDDSPIQMGYQPPEHQGEVAVEALRVFLGLEMPVALNFTGYSGRSEHRMSAVHAYFRQSWRWHSIPNELELQWMFSGYQLYASHHIGQTHHRPYHTETSGHMERRLLDGQWVRWGFDGALIPPPGRKWSTNRRRFILGASGIQRIGSSDLDLRPEYDNSEFDDGAKGGMSQSQEAT